MRKDIRKIIFLIILVALIGFAAFQYKWLHVITGGFGDENNRDSDSMAVYDGTLYVGTRNPETGTQIWEYDGTTWTQLETGKFLYVGTLD